MNSAPRKRDFILRLQLAIGAGICLILVVLAGALNLDALHQSGASREQLVRSQEMLKSIADLRLGYAQVTADIRAHILTGQPSYLRAFDEGIEQLPRLVDAVRSAANRDGTHAAELASLQRDLDLRR